MRVGALITRIMQQMRRDKRTLALLFLAPLVILSLMYFIFNSNESNLTLVVSNGSNQLTEKLQAVDFHVIEQNDFSKEDLKAKEYNGWLDIQQNQFKLTLLNDSPSTAQAVKMKLTQAMQPDNATTMKFSTAYVYGDEDTALFDIFSPMLIGFFVFFFVFLISGIALLKERTSGTLERLLATPIKTVRNCRWLYDWLWAICDYPNDYYCSIWYLCTGYCTCRFHLACATYEYFSGACFFIIRDPIVKLLLHQSFK